jgi:hypothetical protein
MVHVIKLDFEVVQSSESYLLVVIPPHSLQSGTYSAAAWLALRSACAISRAMSVLIRQLRPLSSCRLLQQVRRSNQQHLTVATR